MLNTQHALAANEQVSEEKMKQSILTALDKRNWTVQRADPRLIQAQINVRNRYYAEIDIRYTGTSYARNVSTHLRAPLPPRGTYPDCTSTTPW